MKRVGGQVRLLIQIKRDYGVKTRYGNYPSLEIPTPTIIGKKPYHLMDLSMVDMHSTMLVTLPWKRSIREPRLINLISKRVFRTPRRSS